MKKEQKTTRTLNQWKNSHWISVNIILSREQIHGIRLKSYRQDTMNKILVMNTMFIMKDSIGGWMNGYQETGS